MELCCFAFSASIFSSLGPWSAQKHHSSFIFCDSEGINPTIGYSSKKEQVNLFIYVSLSGHSNWLGKQCMSQGRSSRAQKTQFRALWVLSGQR